MQLNIFLGDGSMEALGATSTAMGLRASLGHRDTATTAGALAKTTPITVSMAMAEARMRPTASPAALASSAELQGQLSCWYKMLKEGFQLSGLASSWCSSLLSCKYNHGMGAEDGTRNLHIFMYSVVDGFAVGLQPEIDNFEA